MSSIKRCDQRITRTMRTDAQITPQPQQPPAGSQSSESTTLVGVSHGLYWPQNHELAQISIPDLLHIVARNALNVIPAERCVVFMYDKASNLLSAQVSTADDQEDDEEELSFAPVLGLVSACFLQRRCLRMQEPLLHKAFHRDYDVPRDIHMNSIIVAPVTLHHRTVGVVQLLNRIDPDAALHGFDLSHEDPIASKSDRDIPVDDDVEVKLLRTKAVLQRPRMGFTAKDEQKMIQFTSHVGQLLDNKLKILAHGESQAKLREERAKTAMELLNMMNEKLELQPTSVPVVSTPRSKRLSVPVLQLMEMATQKLSGESVPPASDTATGPERGESQDTIRPLNGLFEGDMIKVLVGISRTQALFRGHHLRKIHRLSQALQDHKMARRKVRSALVIQRASRLFLARRWRKRRRDAVMTIIRAMKHYHFRARLAERQEIKKRQKRKRSMVVEAPPVKADQSKRVESEVERFRRRFAGAVNIQRNFRGHQVRNEVKKIVGSSNLAKGMKNIVKLQSFLRGSIAKIKVERIREQKRAARAAHVVCMRLASTDGEPVNPVDAAHHVSNSRTCVYPLPNRANAVSSPPPPHTAIGSTSRQELQLHTSQPTTLSPRFRRRRLVPSTVPLPGPENDDSLLCLESRPLVASPRLSPRSSAEQQSYPSVLQDQVYTRAELTRRNPLVVFDIDPKRAMRCPQGVQRADDWLPRNRVHLKKPKKLTAAVVSPPSNQSPLPVLPRLVRPLAPLSPRGIPFPQQLQVCFLPAANAHRASTIQADAAAPMKPPPEPRNSPSHRRALTTR